MSGKFLHGLIVDGDFVDVGDNIFSHSELRKKWTGSEQKHKNIQEWSWDYVTREFVETPKDLIPIVEKWIRENLNTRKKLITWIGKNWEEIVNKDEREREIHIWGLIDQKAKHKNKLINDFLKADSARKQADLTWEQADLTWGQADKKWKTEIMKPIFIELLKKYPNKYWQT